MSEILSLFLFHYDIYFYYYDCKNFKLKNVTEKFIKQ